MVVLLLAVSFLLWRFRPRARLPWSIPLVVVGVILVVRTAAWLTEA